MNLGFHLSDYLVESYGTLTNQRTKNHHDNHPFPELKEICSTVVSIIPHKNNTSYTPKFDIYIFVTVSVKSG